MRSNKAQIHTRFGQSVVPTWVGTHVEHKPSNIWQDVVRNACSYLGYCASMENVHMMSNSILRIWT